jgi:hypothetical protein
MTAGRSAAGDAGAAVAAPLTRARIADLLATVD